MSATIELALLPLFLAVAEHGSYTEAARRLGVGKSLVSRGVARLERELGAELLHRTTRAVALSTAGAALYERAAPLVSSLRLAVGSLPEREEQPSGELRLTAPVDLGVVLLPEVLARYALLHPAVRVDLHLTGRRVDLVREGYDVAIRAGMTRMPGSSMVMRRLGTFAVQLYASPSYLARRGQPRAFGDPAHDWVMFRAGGSPLSLPKGASARVVADDLLFVREALRQGTGVGWLPGFLAEPAVTAGELVRVLPTWQARDGGGGFVLLYPSRRQIPRKVTAFRDVLLESLRGRKV